MAIDWKKIKAEYITTNTSYRKLGEKHGVGYQTICHRAKAEQWGEQREQFTNKTVTKTIEAIGEKQVDRASRLQTVAEKLLQKIERMAECEEIFDAKSVRSLCAAIKDIKDIQGIKSDADMREQEARIKKLEADARHGHMDDDEDETGVVLLPPVLGGK